ncbi:MAG: hypothetical protein PUD20_08720, partial [bacterium]|nr:hypothetical protein [bacterium]
MSTNKKMKISVDEIAKQPYDNYNDYMSCLFAVVNDSMDVYIEDMKSVFANEQGGYKNVLYPDIEIAHDLCKEQVSKFYLKMSEVAEDYMKGTSVEEADESTETENDIMDDLFGDLDDDDLFGDSGFDDALSGIFGDEQISAEHIEHTMRQKAKQLNARDKILHLNSRAQVTIEAGISLPFYEVCKKLEYEPFTIFCFVCGILSSTQTNYAGIYQVINENGNMSA